MAEAVPAPDLKQETLEDLMTRYQQADQAATAELIRQVSPMLFRFLARPAATRGEAEDLLQECWLRIHTARHTYRPGEPALPWIFAIARHTRVDGYRRRGRIGSHETPFEELEKLPGRTSPWPGAAVIDLSRSIDELPESQREVLFMLKVSGMSLKEVARATSSTVGAVKQKAHRAYETLRTKLSR